MHNAAFAKLGLPHRYEAKETADEELAPTLDRMRREDDVLGANVTIPHKESVLRLLDEVDDEARRIGAVNTIVSRGARLIGYNTDKYGFERALEEQVPTEEETPLVKRAKATDNVPVVAGLSMLLSQAARSFGLWTGVPAPIEVMRAALPRVI